MTGSGPLRVSSLAAAIACGIAVCAAEAADSSIESARESRVSLSIEQWFGALAVEPAEEWASEVFLADAPLVFSLTEADDPGSDDLVDWLFALRSSHPRVEFRVGTLRFESLGKDLVRVRFEVDRHSTDAAGLLHLVRREQTWLIRDLPGETPVVLRIEEQRLPAFPGTGPQLVCY